MEMNAGMIARLDERFPYRAMGDQSPAADDLLG
jgi:hypothetical protein